MWQAGVLSHYSEELLYAPVDAADGKPVDPAVRLPLAQRDPNGEGMGAQISPLLFPEREPAIGERSKPMFPTI